MFDDHVMLPALPHRCISSGASSVGVVRTEALQVTATMERQRVVDELTSSAGAQV